MQKLGLVRLSMFGLCAAAAGSMQQQRASECQTHDVNKRDGPAGSIGVGGGRDRDRDRETKR